jgi:HK97 family phage portal protein
MRTTVNSLELRGEAFQYVTGRYADDRIARFVTLNADAVGVEWIDGRLEYLVDGVPVDRRDICHVKYQSWPGRLRGISPLEWTAGPQATSAALELYASRLALRGGIPWAVLKAQLNLDDTQATDAQTAWVAAAQRRDGAPAVIGNAFDLVPLTLSPRDMALLELREFDERRITAAFGVPGYLVNIAMADGLTYANASQLFLHHWTATLRPLAQSVAEAWSNWLLPRGSRLEFNPDRYVQPPLGERASAYATLHNIVDPATGERAIYVSEIRAAERMMPAPAGTDTGDELYAQRLTGGRV